MKFSINSKTLLSRLVAAGKAINNKPTISILSHFMFELEDGMLTITASDSDHVVTSRIAVDNLEGSGKVCVDAKRLTELIKAMPDCPVTFNISEPNLGITIRYTNGKYNLSGLNGIDYPLDNDIKEDEIDGRFEMPASQILSAMDKVGFAIGYDELRPQMAGIFWDVTEDAITFVATDTRVLAKYRSTQTAPGVVTSFILPGRSLSLVRAFIGKQASVKVTTTKNSIFFEGDDFRVRVSKIIARYPDYNRVIPTTHNSVVTADRNDFMNAISRVSICADSQMSLLKLNIQPGTIDAIAQDINYNVGGEERITCDYDGTPIEIGFNAQYLKGVINAIATQNIVIKLLDASRPGLFLPSENDEHGELTLLCMPMSIK